jgi:hypothetical protein
LPTKPLEDNAVRPKVEIETRVAENTPGPAKNLKRGLDVVFDRTLTNLPADKSASSQLSVDVFYCDGDGSALRRDFASSIGASIATLSRYEPVKRDSIIGKVRLRALKSDSKARADYPMSSNFILFDPNDARAKIWAEAIAKGSAIPLELKTQRGETPDYLSVVICSNSVIGNAAAGAPKQTVYFQIASRQQENIARRAIAELKTALPTARVYDSLDYQPNTSPSRSEVRYYFPEDEIAAKALASALEGTLNEKVAPKKLSGFKDAKAQTFEVWIGRSVSDSGKDFWTSRDVELRSLSIKQTLKDAF